MRQVEGAGPVGLRAPLRFIVCVAVLAAGCIPSYARKSARRFTLEGAIGAGMVPMSEWQDFWEGLGPYREQRLAGFYELGLRYHPSPRHVVALSYERLTTEASVPVVSYYGTLRDTVGYAFGELQWEFEATPVSVSYEFYPRGTLTDVSPYVGIGVSYYFFAGLSASYTEYENTFMPEMSYDGTRGGRGYGVHAYIGCRARLAGRLYFVARVRGRYADGMGFTDQGEDVPVHFGGVDAALGVGCEF